jgi:hypothetical protein
VAVDSVGPLCCLKLLQASAAIGAIHEQDHSFGILGEPWPLPLFLRHPDNTWQVDKDEPPRHKD